MAGGRGRRGRGSCGDACTPRLQQHSLYVHLCIHRTLVPALHPDAHSEILDHPLPHPHLICLYISYVHLAHTHKMAKHAANKGKTPLTDKNNKRKRDAQDNKHEDAPVALFAAVKDTELDDIFAKSVSVHRPWPFSFPFFFFFFSWVKRLMLMYRHSRTPFLHLCLLPAHQKLISRRHLSPLPKRAKRALHPKCKWKRMWK